VLTGSADETARLRDVATGQQLGPALRQPDSVEAVAFHPDGKAILTADRVKRAWVWRVPTPIPGEAERLSLWAQVRTGMELGEDGAPRLLDAGASRQRRQLLREQGGPPLR
jgi:hypothetical protein